MTVSNRVAKWRRLVNSAGDKGVTRDHEQGTVIMGFTRPRTGRNGVVRYQALHDDVKGHRRSPGTFATEGVADKA